MRAWPSWRWWLALAAGGGLFLLAAAGLKGTKHKDVAVEMQVALPLFVQVAMMGGDRYLAANAASIRALVVTTERMRAGEYKILARVQTDASWLNPAHEDNYYIAAALLPWNGEVEAAQTVLRRAGAARPLDYQPAFFYAFNLFHFLGDPEGASHWLRAAADKLPEGDERLTMQNFAVRWLDRSRDLDQAILVVEAMAKQSQRRDFRRYLLMRAQRLRDLKSLRNAAAAYQERTGQPLRRLDQLVGAGLIASIPQDPFGLGFDIDAAGQPSLLNAPRK